MANSGIYPPNPNTPVGQVRLVVGDETATDVTNGVGAYTYFSDDAISAALTVTGGTPTRAVAALIRQLATSLTISGQSIRASDFAINTLGRGGTLIEVANSYEQQADAEDERKMQEDAGAIVVVHTPMQSTPATGRPLSRLLG